MSVTESKEKRSVNPAVNRQKSRRLLCLPAGADGGSERAAGLTD